MFLPYRQFRRFLSREQGVVTVEFALSISFLLLLFLGSIEVTRYVLVVQKVEKTVTTVADVVTQSTTANPLSSSQMSALLGTVGDMMSPYPVGANGIVIVTDLSGQSGANPILNWQYCGGGTSSATSEFGSTAGGAGIAAAISNAQYNAFPGGLTLNAGEEAVIVEMYFKYTPITTTKWSIMGTSTLYRVAVFTPRIGALTGFSSHC